MISTEDLAAIAKAVADELEKRGLGAAAPATPAPAIYATTWRFVPDDPNVPNGLGWHCIGDLRIVRGLRTEDPYKIGKQIPDTSGGFNVTADGHVHNASGDTGT